MSLASSLDNVNNEIRGCLARNAAMVFVSYSCHDRTTPELSLILSTALLLVLWSFADKTHLTQKCTLEPVLVEQMHSTDSALARVGKCCDHNLTRLISVQGGQNPRCCSQDLSTVLARLVSDQAHGSDMS